MTIHAGPGLSAIEAAVEAAVAAHGSDPARLLALAGSVQDALRCVPPAAQTLLAARLDVPPARVRSVVDFYSFFSATPRGEYDLLLGTCVADEFNGAPALLARLAAALDVEPGTTRTDGRVSLGTASCTGLCDQPVAALVNGRPLARLDAAAVDRIAALIAAGTPLAQWPAGLEAAPSRVPRRVLLLDDGGAPGAALARARTLGPAGLLRELADAGLRGRGGAGYRTELKWRQCRESVARPGAAAVICNADEGEPGTFKDRWLLEHEAERLIEGMTLCAYALGGAEGWIYLRGEYRYLREPLQRLLAGRRAAGLLGASARERLGVVFDIHVCPGAGAYICGEESALIESLEGKRGVPRNRPPYPVSRGYLGLPTVVNNVETFVAAASIGLHGGAWYAAHGTGQSRGTKLLSVSGDCARPGIYEYPFGISVREVLADAGADAPVAVQVGGPSGKLIAPAEFDKALGYEALATGGAFMIFGAGREVLDVVRNHARFFAHESCGFCTPCRVGTALQRDLFEKLYAGHGTSADLAELERLARLINRSTHCGLGQTAGNPVLDSLGRFAAGYGARLTQSYSPGFDLDGAVAEARAITGRDDPRAHLHG